MTLHIAGARHGNVNIAPTLQNMRDLYQLSRSGGAASPRFQSYLKRAPEELGLVAYNPMAGAAALETVEQLIACDAEALAMQTATRVVAECNYEAGLTLAVAVRSAGLWTDRVATEVDERASGKPRTADFGIISLWSGEPCAETDIIRESAAECVRIMWTATHGVADTLCSVLACEGFAYAIASGHAVLNARLFGNSSVAGDEESIAVMGALDILGDSRSPSDIAGVLFGDGAAVALGWTPLGIGEYAGYRWAIARAAQHLQQVGGALALRAKAVP